MPRKANFSEEAPEVDVHPETGTRWSGAELLAVKHLGPGIIGQAQYDAAQRYVTSTNNGVLGPAILETPKA